MEQGQNETTPPRKTGVSGKPIVFAVFGGALLMWATVLLIGMNEKKKRHAHEGVETISEPTAVRTWMAGLPGRWTRVTQVEGQGWVIYVPCYSSNSELAFRTAPDSLPGIACEYCDSLDVYTVKSASRPKRDSVWEFGLDPAAGSLRLVPVRDSLLKSFPEAPFKDRILIWSRMRGEGKSDSMIFVPKEQESEFETLRAEDENPEGCGGAEQD
jgi:hypothetical protein